GQQQHEFLAAVARREVGLVARRERERLADHAQALVALKVAVAVVEQLEMVDVDHHQGNRALQIGGALPFGFESGIGAAAVRASCRYAMPISRSIRRSTSASSRPTSRRASVAASGA